MIEDDFISFRNGQFVWTSIAGREWDAAELIQATLKQTLTPEDEAAVFAIVDQLHRLTRDAAKKVR